MPSRRTVLATAAVIAVALGLTPTSRRLQEYLGPAYGSFSYGTGGYGGGTSEGGGYGGSGNEVDGPAGEVRGTNEVDGPAGR